MTIQAIGVLGAGQMGGGIAQVAATAGFDVRLCDASLDLAKNGVAKIGAMLKKQVEKGKLDPQAGTDIVFRIVAIDSPSGFRGCDLVIEAATENLDLKLKLFRQCDEALGPDGYLASNTSSISLTRLAAEASRPERVIGWHCMHPPP